MLAPFFNCYLSAKIYVIDNAGGKKSEDICADRCKRNRQKP